MTDQGLLPKQGIIDQLLERVELVQRKRIVGRVSRSEMGIDAHDIETL